MASKNQHYDHSPSTLLLLFYYFQSLYHPCFIFQAGKRPCTVETPGPTVARMENPGNFNFYKSPAPVTPPEVSCTCGNPSTRDALSTTCLHSHKASETSPRNSYSLSHLSSAQILRDLHPWHHYLCLSRLWCTCNAVTKKFCDLHGIPVKTNHSSTSFQFGNFGILSSLGSAIIPYTLSTCPEKIEAFVFTNISHDLIFGIPWFDIYSPGNWDRPFLTVNLQGKHSPVRTTRNPVKPTISLLTPAQVGHAS